MDWLAIANYDFKTKGVTDTTGLAGDVQLHGGSKLTSEGLHFPASSGAFARIGTPFLWSGGVMGKVTFRIPKIDAKKRYNLMESSNGFALFLAPDGTLRATFRHSSGAWLGTWILNQPVTPEDWHTVMFKLGTGKPQISLDGGVVWEVSIPGLVPQAPPTNTGNGGIILGAWAGNLGAYPMTNGALGSIQLSISLPPKHEHPAAREHERESRPRAHETPRNVRNVQRKPPNVRLSTNFSPDLVARLTEDPVRLLRPFVDGMSLKYSDEGEKRLRRDLRGREGREVLDGLRHPTARESQDAGRKLALLLIRNATDSDKQMLMRLTRTVDNLPGAEQVMRTLPWLATCVHTLENGLKRDQRS